MLVSYSLALPFFAKFEQAFKISAVLQAIFMFLSAIVLDGGQLFQFMLVCATGYWCAVGIIMIRRNGNATALDSFLMKWGYPLTIPLVMAVSGVVPIGLLRHG